MVKQTQNLDVLCLTDFVSKKIMLVTIGFILPCLYAYFLLSYTAHMQTKEQL